MSAAPHRVAVIGGGFGGLEAAKHLAATPVEVTLIDRRNFHLFQPLSYQVATGALSPAEVCYPLGAIFKGRPNVRVVMATVVAVDLGERRLRLRPGAEGGEEFEVDYDALVVAAGSAYSYFGHEEWRGGRARGEVAGERARAAGAAARRLRGGRARGRGARVIAEGGEERESGPAG